MNEILDEKEQTTQSTFKVKHVIIVFIFGCIILAIGSLFKIESWPYASELIFLGYLVYVISLILAIIKLIAIKDSKSFFNK